uniref:Crystallin zeta like 1 n=1 Tax=Piliocolobus tephrosceles TaxID=591936 RepID=A0A8C9GQY1_9PRIM
MKGLYFQQSSTDEEITFVFQERENLPVTEDNFVKLQVKACALSQINTKLLAEMKMKKDLFPVGREIAGIVLDVGSKVSFFQPDDEVVEILSRPGVVTYVCNPSTLGGQGGRIT